MILIVGHKGNMGRRYAAILNHLGKSWTGVDVEWQAAGQKDLQYFDKSALEGVIVASPTDQHADHVTHFIKYRVPILCEKPISKDLGKLKQVISECRDDEIKLDMVWQYRNLVTSTSKNPSKYDYFNHGRDGLHWDCIQIISLANGKVQLDEKSPTWDCVINGRRLHIDQMDGAYVNMVKLWLKNPKQNLGEIELAHIKVKELINENENLNRNTGKINLQ